jgi:hypothetical protein
MQLIWIGGPAHRIVSFSWTARRLWVGGLLIATVLLLMGGLMHFMGLRVAVDFAPELVRSMGGVASQSQLQKLEEQHALQLQSLQSRVQVLQTQLQTLHTTQNQWLQGLGWKSNSAVSGDKPPSWLQSGGWDRLPTFWWANEICCCCYQCLCRSCETRCLHPGHRCWCF